MSRLYFKGSSDTKKKTTSTGNRELEGSLYVGSASNSIEVLSFNAVYDKGNKSVKVWVDFGGETRRIEVDI